MLWCAGSLLVAVSSVVMVIVAVVFFVIVIIMMIVIMVVVRFVTLVSLVTVVRNLGGKMNDIMVYLAINMFWNYTWKCKTTEMD